MPERRTILLDTLRPHPGIRPGQFARDILSRSPVARRYLFDPEASGRIGTFMREHLDLVVDNIEFARAPYPTTYLEIDSRAMWRQWRPGHPVLETSDTRVGFLVDGDTVLVLAGGDVSDGPSTFVGSLYFRINRPQRVPMATLTGETLERAEVAKQAFVLGGRRSSKPYELGNRPRWQPEDVLFPALPVAWSPAQVSSHFDVGPVYPMLSGGDLVEHCFLGGGDPMTALVALLLLNQPSHVTSVERIPGSRGIYKGKLKSYREHNLVTIHLDAAERVFKDWRHTERASPIMHDVEGHWRNYNKTSGCEHAWEPVGADRTASGDHRRYWCPKCLQRRTWTEAHVRGDATRGVATKEYGIKR